MRGRTISAIACAALALPLLGCGSGGGSTASNASGANLPPIDDTRGGSSATPMARTSQVQPRQGMSTGKKVMILAGAAAVYYLYKKNQEKKAAGQLSADQPQYYLSKNGRVYYRDRNAQVHYVTPPAQGIPVPYDEAQQYRQLQGYDNQSTGVTDLSRFATSGGM